MRFRKLSEYKIAIVGTIVSQSEEKIKTLVSFTKNPSEICRIFTQTSAKPILFYTLFTSIIHNITLARTREV